MFDADEVDVAPNLINTLNPAVRLPLLESRAVGLTFEGTFGVFRTWVPSRFGGELEVGCDKPGAEVVVTFQDNPVVDAAGAPVPKGSTVKCTVPAGQFGWHDIAVGKVSGSYRMWATFSEIGIAREGADPLIPWNFWYFPYARSQAEFTAWGSSGLHPCTKYETAFGRSGVLQWELDHHNDPSGTQLGWVGHCHNSAPASIIFKTPDPAGKTVGGVAFSCEELKYFAAEFYGRKGNDHFGWGLPETGFRKGFFQEHKPEDNPKRFGTLIPDFHKAFRSLLRDDQRAGFMDLRDISGGDHSAVWNQAIYKYVAQMWETTPHGDWHDIQVRTTLFGNEDKIPGDFSSSGSPARITATGPGPGGTPKDTFQDSSTPIFRNEILRYRLIYKPDGEINAKHAKNEWQSAETEDGTGLHAPRFLFVVDKPTGNSDPDGNTQIDLGDIPALLELRDVFK